MSGFIIGVWLTFLSPFLTFLFRILVAEGHEGKVTKIHPEPFPPNPKKKEGRKCQDVSVTGRSPYNLILRKTNITIVDLALSVSLYKIIPLLS